MKEPKINRHQTRQSSISLFDPPPSTFHSSFYHSEIANRSGQVHMRKAGEEEVRRMNTEATCGGYHASSRFLARRSIQVLDELFRDRRRVPCASQISGQANTRLQRLAHRHLNTFGRVALTDVLEEHGR